MLVALGAAALTLATSFGGTEYPWGSPEIIGLFVAGVVFMTMFVFAELRAKEPMLPMRLFRGNVFSVSSILAFIVGFAMLGALTFLPTYLQYVKGVSATASGIRTLPLVFGLLLTSVFAGNVVSKTGKYRVFPIAGGAVMAVGMYLLSRLDEFTSVVLTEAGEDEFRKVANAWKSWLRSKLPEAEAGGPSAEALDGALARLAAKVTEQEQLALAA